LISQLLNLSSEKTFNLYKRKYNFSTKFKNCIYGIELRDVSIDSIVCEENRKNDNYFFIDDCMLLIGSFSDLIETSSILSLNHKIKSEIIQKIEKYNRHDFLKYKIGNRIFDFKFSYVMGILNVTPDSFSDGGKYAQKNKAVEHALRMIDEGADIIDVGGESTRPGSEPVSTEEEMKRVVPVICEIISQKPETIISIDTTKSDVAKEAIKNGASIINDISGGSFDTEMFSVAQEFDTAMIIMHISGKPQTMQNSPSYKEVVSEVYDILFEQTEIALNIGIEKIIIDPGIGFGKRIEDNLNLIERLQDLKSLGYPILIGLSRKSFIGNILNLPVQERDDVSNALNAVAINNGARIIRTHNVKQAVQTSKIFNRIIAN